MAITPDGARLAYCTGGADTSEAPIDPVQRLLVQDLATGQVVERYRAATGEHISESAWSPDGRELAFISTDARFRSHILIAGDQSVYPLAHAPGGEHHQWWSLGWLPNGIAVSVHDMQDLFVFDRKGHLQEQVALPKIMGSGSVHLITSTDRLLASPRDSQLFAYTQSVPGTQLFEHTTHESNTALSLHDRFLGTGKNLRLTPPEITVSAIAWSPDGRFLYFSGYRDQQAGDRYPFRIHRIQPNRQGLAVLPIRGERVSVGCPTPASTDTSQVRSIHSTKESRPR